MGNLKNRSGNLFYQTSKYHRFTGFDILKFLCAFLIVCIHSPFPGMIGEYFTALTRIAVPIFFMITGFYYSDIEWRDRTIEQIKKIFILVVEANLLYLLWKCFYAVASGDGLIPYIEEILTEKCIAKFVILNESPFNGHLWYLGAILYVLLIVESLRRFGGGYWWRVLYVATPLLLIGDLLLGKYSILMWRREFPYIFVRNWLFVGMPYFSIGMMLREKVNTTNLRTMLLMGLTAVFSLTTLMERYFLVSAGVNATRDHYVSTTFLAVTVFLLFLSIYRFRQPRKIELFMASVGKKYSTWVYIVHPIFITVLAVGTRRFVIYDAYQYVAPFVIYFVSICFVAIMRGMIKYVQNSVHEPS